MDIQCPIPKISTKKISIHFLKVFKVETVGDSYLTVGGIPEQLAEHAEMICHVAIGKLQLTMARRSSSTRGVPLPILVFGKGIETEQRGHVFCNKKYSCTIATAAEGRLPPIF